MPHQCPTNDEVKGPQPRSFFPSSLEGHWFPPQAGTLIRHCRAGCVAISLLVFAASAGAQPRPDPAELPALRYELGQRLKRFEAAWEKHTAPESRQSALRHVEKLTQQFF